MPDIDKLRAMLPDLTDANRGFWEGTAMGQFRLQYGPSGVPRYPESPVDPVTLETQAEWREASGRGTLWSWIVMHQKYFPAFADDGSYLVALIALEEGPYVMSTLVDPPKQLTIGLPVEAVFERLDDSRSLPKFKVVSK